MVPIEKVATKSRVFQVDGNFGRNSRRIGLESCIKFKLKLQVTLFSAYY